MIYNLFPIRTYKSQIDASELKEIKDLSLQYIKKNESKFKRIPSWKGDTLTDFPMTDFQNYTLRNVILKHAYLYFRLLDNTVKIPRIRIIDIWININKKETFQEEHNHLGIPYKHYSGTLFLYGSKIGGEFEFRNPNNFVATLPPNDVFDSKIKPKEGVILLFPSYLPHRVNPHYDKENRITISFNYVFDMKYKKRDFWENYQIEDIAPYNGESR